jgi:hypothetical protein
VKEVEQFLGVVGRFLSFHVGLLRERKLTQKPTLARL